MIKKTYSKRNVDRSKTVSCLEAIFNFLLVTITFFIAFIGSMNDIINYDFTNSFSGLNEIHFSDISTILLLCLLIYYILCFNHGIERAIFAITDIDTLCFEHRTAEWDRIYDLSIIESREIWIMGISVQSFLLRDGEMQRMLDNGGKIKIILMNPNYPALFEECIRRSERTEEMKDNLYFYRILYRDLNIISIKLIEQGKNRNVKVKYINYVPSFKMIICNPSKIFNKKSEILVEPYLHQCKNKELFINIRGQHDPRYLEFYSQYEQIWKSAEFIDVKKALEIVGNKINNKAT